METSIEYKYVCQWQENLQRFSKQPVTWWGFRLKPNWDQLIQHKHTVYLFDKKAEDFEKEISDYYKHSKPIRWMQALITPIARKEQLWRYYRNLLAFEAAKQKLSPEEQSALEHASIKIITSKDKVSLAAALPSPIASRGFRLNVFLAKWSPFREF